MPLSRLLTDLGDLVQQGGKLAQEIRRGGIRPELKPDDTLVTVADRAVEEFLRPRLVDLVPNSTVWGEEFGFSDPGPKGLWVVDPIDGTSNFSFGSPLWGVTAALVDGEDIRFGALYLPDLGELYLAEKGEGAYKDGERIGQIPPGAPRPEELVSYSDGLMRKVNFAKLPGKMRCAGAFVIDGSFTATQRYRGMIGHKERLYDIGTSVLLCQEAGADVRYADGSPLSLVELTRPVQIERPWIMFPQDSGFYLPNA